MPTIFDPKDLPIREQNGATYTTLANAAMLGTEALLVERVTLESGRQTELASAAEAERFLYVIRGSGQAHIGGDTFPLAAESMLWIEPGDMCTIEAGVEKLEVLLCRAPAK